MSEDLSFPEQAADYYRQHQLSMEQVQLSESLLYITYKGLAAALTLESNACSPEERDIRGIVSKEARQLAEDMLQQHHLAHQAYAVGLESAAAHFRENASDYVTAALADAKVASCEIRFSGLIAESVSIAPIEKSKESEAGTGLGSADIEYLKLVAQEKGYVQTIPQRTLNKLHLLEDHWSDYGGAAGEVLGLFADAIIDLNILSQLRKDRKNDKIWRRLPDFGDRMEDFLDEVIEHRLQEVAAGQRSLSSFDK